MAADNLIIYLRDCVSPALAGRDVTEIGNKMYVTLDDDRRVEISLYESCAKNNYNALLFKLFSKTHGELHTRTVGFEEMFASMQDMTHPNKLWKHVWRDRGKCMWYGKPTRSDYIAMQNVVTEYIALWE